MSVFGRNVKKLRISKNLNQQEFGEIFEISRGSIGSYEEGRAEPKIETLLKISTYFKISVDDLLSREIKLSGINQDENSTLLFEEKVESEPPNKNKKKYLEERVADLEAKFEAIEKIFKPK